MVTENNSTTALCANSSDENSTVKTDDDEFSEFISSQWKDGVEIGLVIEYPLPHTHYLQPFGADSTPQYSNDGVGEGVAVEATEGATTAEESMVGSSIEIGTSESSDERKSLPPLELSTVLQEEFIAPLFNGTQWAGTRVWKAAILGLEYLLRERRQSPNGGRRYRSLLELGCGLGVPGMVWKQVLTAEQQQQTDNDLLSQSNSRVVLTDMDSLVSQLQSNVTANFPGDPSIEAKALDWSREGIRSLLESERDRLPKGTTTVFDVCLNCDCVYEPLYGREAWESLADVLAELGQSSPETLLVTALERRNGDNVEGFFKRLEESGKVETPVQRVVRDATDPHHVIEIYVTRGRASE